MFLMMDTNIYVRDYNFASTAYRKLKEQSYQLGIKMFVSSVVIDEVISNYRELLYDFNKKNENFKSVPDKYLNKIPNEDIDKLVNEYTGFFRNQIRKFNAYGTRELYFEQIDFRIVYERAIHKSKPFNIGGKGFKDSLIWEHVKEAAITYCSDERKFAFVTTNVKDFSDEEKLSDNDVWFLPAKNLRMEYMKDGYPEDTIRIYDKLESFNIDVVYRKIDGFNAYIEKLNSVLNGELSKYIIESLRDESIVVDNGSYGEYSVLVKKVFSAKAVEAFNDYGNATDEIVFLVKLEVLCEPTNASIPFMASAKMYIRIDTKTGEFISHESLDIINAL